MNEPNESKVANLLAKLDNLPAYDIGGFKRAVIEILEEQQKQIEEKEKALTKLRERFEEHEDFKPELAHGEDEE